MKKNDIVNEFHNNGLKNTKINLGIQILRLLLCFWIVIVHCSKIKNEHQKYLFRGFHVPTFIFLSFYFYYPIISRKNIDKITSRFQRLLLPYTFWPIIRLLLFTIKNHNIKYILRNIILQLLIGSPIHGHFWFLFNLIFLSLFFAIILFSFNKNGIKILIFTELFCYYLHISGLGFDLLNNFTYLFRKNIGSLIEIIPLSVNGCIFSIIKYLFINKRSSIYLYFIFFIIIFILFNYDIFIEKKGFICSRVSLYIISSSILFLLFGTLPFEKVQKNEYIILVIKYITQFTGGIYYIHSIVRDFIHIYSYSFLKRNYFYSLIIYVICYSICFIGNKFFKNYKLKYLFL